MGIKIESIVQFTNLAVGVPVALPHGLVNPPRNLVPDLLVPNEGGFQVTADDIDITVTRLADDSPDAVDVWASSWHTMRREFGSTQPQPGIQPDGSLVPQPFVINQGVSQAAEAAVSGKITASVAQVLPAAADTKLTFDVTDYDFGGIVNIGLDRFVIVTAGRYSVEARYGTQSVGANHVQRLSIAVNGILVKATQTLTSIAGRGVTVVFASDFDLAVGDFLEVFALLNTGASTLTGLRESMFAVHSNF